MNNFKEFSAKSIDLAIEEACHYYDLAREKLEIEILEDAKSGIFGIVGVRKAKIKAKKADINAKSENIKAQDEFKLDSFKADNLKNDKKVKAETKPEAKAVEKAKQAVNEPEQSKVNNKKPVKKDFKAVKHNEDDISESHEKLLAKTEQAETDSKPEPQTRERRPRNQSYEKTDRSTNKIEEKSSRKPELERAKKSPSKDYEADELDDSLPKLSLLELDQEKLMNTAREYTHTIFKYLLPDTEIVLSIRDDKIVISITGDEAIELSGRNGQNLFSIQYILSRMMTKAMESHIRVTFDSGDYKERQEAQLIEVAHNLAEKVKNTGKSMSTRPLSSYHRRIIHVSLQNESELTTKSIGEGQLKKVIIFKKRRNA